MPENKTQPRIVFMGTPDFAVRSAELLAASGVQILAVVTAPDRPAGRGLQLQPPEMKKWAEAHQIPILQPKDLRAPDFIAALRAIPADLYVVVAFRILPPELIRIPPRGVINLHASLLPKYRGAAPINWALINGEQETGVTTFLIDEKMDTGDILLQEATAIAPDENFGQLYGRLKELGASLLVKTVRQYAAGEIAPQKQVGEPTRAPKLTPELRLIDWRRPAREICNLVRGLSPKPAAITRLQGKVLKIYRCEVIPAPVASASPGAIIAADAAKPELFVAAADGLLSLLDVQLEGKKRMDIGAFLRGHRVHPGDRLG